jgi:hypothetical protein
MKLTDREIALFRNTLLARKMYEHTTEVLGYNPWQPWMQSTLDKLNDELSPANE